MKLGSGTGSAHNTSSATHRQARSKAHGFVDMAGEWGRGVVGGKVGRGGRRAEACWGPKGRLWARETQVGALGRRLLFFMLFVRDLI